MIRPDVLVDDNVETNEQPASAAPMQRRSWLASLLIGRQRRLLPRFLNVYQRILQRPRHIRRQLVRKGAVTLAGAALLLALGRGPAGSGVVHAANIDVDEVTCTLVDAIRSANNDASYGGCTAGNGADTITLLTDVTLTDSYATYYFSYTGLPLITSEITIEGGDQTIERNTADPDKFRILAVSSSGDLTLNNVTLSGGYAYSTFTGPYETYYYGDGGAIYIDGGTLAINDSTISGNTARDDGGGLLSEDSTLTITNTTFDNNEAVGDTGGGINVDEGTLTLTGSTVSNNTAYDDGGGIEISNYSVVEITNSTISGNTAGEDGGGIENGPDGQVTITNSIISGNEAGYEGGGVFNGGYSTMTISDSTLTDNTADSDGGGVYNRSGTTNITGSTISGNYAGDDGGGVYNDEGETTLVNSTISGNTAVDGGGGVRQQAGDGTTTIINTTITDNTADDHGGGIDAVFGTLTLERSIVSGNNATPASEIYIHDYDEDTPVVNVNAYNLFGHGGVNNAAAFYNFTAGASDITATSDGTDPTALADILEVTLADNGGSTETHALVAGSPAIDTAPSADCTAAPVNGLDQRGEPRNADGDGSASANECDSGAFEFQPETAAALIYLSAETAGSVDGVDFDRNDILLFDGSNWSKFFDGSDVGLTNSAHNVYTIHVNAADDLFLSLFQNKVNVPGVGQVFGHDILHFDGSGLERVFDGSDVGLTTVSEKLDALHVAADPPVGCDAYYLISTFGTGKVPGIPGQFSGEDVLGFCETAGAPNTAGTWELVLDGSAFGMPNNSTFGLSASDDLETLYLITTGTFNVDSAMGGHSMVYKFEGGEFSGPFFSAPAEGLDEKVDGLHVEGDLP